MTQSYYSWMGTPLHLILDDDFAAAYNRAQAAFFQAQKDHLARTGSHWDPINEHLLIHWTDEEQSVFDQFAVFMNSYIELNGGSLHITDEEMTSNYLVKL